MHPASEARQTIHHQREPAAQVLRPEHNNAEIETNCLLLELRSNETRTHPSVIDFHLPSNSRTVSHFPTQ